MNRKELKYFLIGSGIFLLLLILTGTLLPSIISTDLLPMPAILILVFIVAGSALSMMLYAKETLFMDKQDQEKKQDSFTREYAKDMTEDQCYEKSKLSIMRAKYFLANSLNGESYQLLITHIDLMSAAMLATLVFAIRNEKENIPEAQKNMQHVLQGLDELVQQLLEKNEEGKK
jgi:hypothetical protein